MKKVIFGILLSSTLAACGGSETNSPFEKWVGTYIYECQSGCENLATAESADQNQIAAKDGIYTAVFVDKKNYDSNNIQISLGGGPYGDLEDDGAFSIASDNPTNQAGGDAVACEGNFTETKEGMTVNCKILIECEGAADPECFEKVESCDPSGLHLGGLITETCGQSRFFKEAAQVGPIEFKLICSNTIVGECPAIE